MVSGHFPEAIFRLYVSGFSMGFDQSKRINEKLGYNVIIRKTGK